MSLGPELLGWILGKKVAWLCSTEGKTWGLNALKHTSKQPSCFQPPALPPVVSGPLRGSLPGVLQGRLVCIGSVPKPSPAPPRNGRLFSWPVWALLNHLPPHHLLFCVGAVVWGHRCLLVSLKLRVCVSVSCSPCCRGCFSARWREQKHLDLGASSRVFSILS